MNNKLLEDARAAGFDLYNGNLVVWIGSTPIDIGLELIKFAELQQPQWIDSNIAKPSLLEGQDYSKNVFGLYKSYQDKLRLSVFQLIVVNELENGYEWAWAKLGDSWADLRESECEFDDDYEVMYWMPINLPSPPINTEGE